MRTSRKLAALGLAVLCLYLGAAGGLGARLRHAAAGARQEQAGGGQECMDSGKASHRHQMWMGFRSSSGLAGVVQSVLTEKPSKKT